ncbi:MAG: hypothetical protein R6W90_01505, partial [Ignavibacteriaceae bacterium]
TNNPRKIVGLEGYGLRITGREPLEVAPTDHNRDYLEAKRSKLGHILDRAVDPAMGDGTGAGGAPRVPRTGNGAGDDERKGARLGAETEAG